MGKKPKQKKEPLDEFKDWLNYTHAEGRGGYRDGKEKKRPPKSLVKKNVALLLNPEKWEKEIKKFESVIKNPSERKKYVIQFTGHDFTKEKKFNGSFRKYKFPCSVDFSDTKFENQNVDFSDAIFVYKVNFQKAKFVNSNLSFNRANFGEGSVRFNDLYVDNGNIYLTVNKFESSNFVAERMVIKGTFNVVANFPGKVKFKRLMVYKTASFSGTKFEKEVPDFRDAKFECPPEVSGMEVPRPILDISHKKIQRRIPNKNHIFSFKCTRDPISADKYRKLKAMALVAHDHEKDGEFFACEMMAKRGWETKDFWGLLFNSFYYALSDYGQSIVRPAKWMWRSFLAFTAFYLILISICIDKFIQIFYAPFLSAYNVLPVFGGVIYSPFAPKGYESSLLDKLNPLPEKGLIVDLIVFIGAVQGIFGIVLLFLFLLGFRNKFRLK